MAWSAFDDKASPPTEKSLLETLGRAGPLWTRLRGNLESAHGPLVEEWTFAGKAYGWSLRLKQKKRAIVYMTPCREYFLASFALGEKACAAARAARLPARLLAIIDAAPRYVEGRGVRIPVKRASDVAGVEKLAAIKIAN
jgi:Protein of unknown function (DUF3788)